MLCADHDNEEDPASAECHLWSGSVRQEGVSRLAGDL